MYNCGNSHFTLEQCSLFEGNEEIHVYSNLSRELNFGHSVCIYGNDQRAHGVQVTFTDENNFTLLGNGQMINWLYTKMITPLYEAEL